MKSSQRDLSSLEKELDHACPAREKRTAVVLCPHPAAVRCAIPTGERSCRAPLDRFANHHGERNLQAEIDRERNGPRHAALRRFAE